MDLKVFIFFRWIKRFFFGVRLFCRSSRSSQITRYPVHIIHFFRGGVFFVFFNFFFFNIMLDQLYLCGFCRLSRFV